MSDVVQRLILQARADTEDAKRKLTDLGGVARTVGAGFAVIAAAAAAGAAALGVAGAAALKQQQVFDNLRASINSTGIAYDEVTGDIAAFLAEQQRFTQFGDDATAAAMAQIARLTGAMRPSLQDLQELTALAQDASVALGIDLAGASRIVARAYAGNAEALAEVLPAQRDYIRELAKIPDQAVRSAAAVDLLTGAVGGASREINEARLGLARMQNAIGDIVEAFGSFAVQSRDVGASVNAIADALDAVAVAFDPATANGRAFASEVGNAIKGLTGIVLELGIQTLTVIRNARGIALETRRMLGFGEDADLESRQQGLASAAELLARATSGSPEQRARATTQARGGNSPLQALVSEGLIAQGELERLSRDLDAGGVRYRSAVERLTALVETTNARAQEVGMRRGGLYTEEMAGDAALRELEASFARIATELAGSEGGLGQSGGAARVSSAVAGVGDAAAGSTGQLVGFGNAADWLVQQLARLAAEAEESKAKMFGQVDQGDGAMAESEAYIAKMKEMIDLEQQQIDLANIARSTQNLKFAEAQAASTSLANLVKGDLANSLATVTSGLFDLTMTAEAGFGALAGSALKSFGSLSSSAGRFLLLAGLGFSALPLGFSGAGAVAAGLGLIALGSALGFAGGKVGGSGGGSGGATLGGSTGVRSTVSPQAERQALVINDYGGATFIGDDPTTMRRLAERQDKARSLGGVGVAL
jgi:hypothetical protein